MAKSLNSVAISYYQSGDKDNALKNWLQALSIVEELGDKSAISKYLNNMRIYNYESISVNYKKFPNIDEKYRDGRSVYGKAIKSYLEIEILKQEGGQILYQSS